MYNDVCGVSGDGCVMMIVVYVYLSYMLFIICEGT